MNKKIIKTAYISLFCILIALPLIQINTNIFKVKALDEKRVKASKPQYSRGMPLGKYINDFEAYYKDNFGFRESLIRLSNTIDFKTFNKSPNPNVIIGKDDYLFFGEEIDDFDRVSTLKDEEIEIIASKIKAFQDELSKRNIDFLFTLAPNKSTIYPEYMGREPKNPKGERNYEKLSAALTRKGVKYLDFKDILLENKNKYPLYYKRDTHWNKISASLIADSIIKNLGPKYGIDGGIQVGDIIKENYAGDLDGLLGINSGITEYSTKPVITEPTKKLPKTVCYSDSFSYDVLPFMDKFFSQRVDLHNTKSPLYNTYPVFYNNNKIVYFEIVERYIYKLLNYEFEVFDNTTTDLDKKYSPLTINLDKDKNPNITLTNAFSETIKDKGYTYFASTAKNGSISITIDPKDAEYLYIELDHIDRHTGTLIGWTSEGETYNKEKLIAMEFNPIKTKYVIHLKGKGKGLKTLNINIDQDANKELNIKTIKLY